MLIQDMSRETSVDFLKGARLGRIACAQGAQPYVTPFSFAHDGGSLYSLAHIGKRIEWMRANPLVCVEVDDIVTRREWRTVVIFGRYQELPDTPEFAEARVLAHDLLSATPSWWEPGFAKNRHDEAAPGGEPIYFRVSIGEMSGRQAIAG
jgi:nitroimidazol reductase NimA-like FMN-containing flavoprotein (pyridoxamine 5'-phosphate oxidase superfamily)